MVDDEGAVLAEVVDDEVSVLQGRKVAVRFREVEAEVTGKAPDGLLDGLVARLRAAGAGPPDPTSKVKRALGPVADGLPDLVEEPLGRHPTAADVIRQAITRSVLRLLAHDPGVRLGDDPEDVHQARVATRRLRSDLRTFRDLLDADWAQGLRDRLKVVAGALGAVRDADVLLERLHRQLDDLPVADRGAGRGGARPAAGRAGRRPVGARGGDGRPRLRRAPRRSGRRGEGPRARRRRPPSRPPAPCRHS